jgi:hypothetical protein
MGFNNELIRSLGMALIHSLWEGIAVLALVMFALSLPGKTNTKIRYSILVSGLMLCVASFLATWYIIYHRIIQSVPLINYSHLIYSHAPGMIREGTWAWHTSGFVSSFQHYLEPFYPTLATGWILGFLFMLIKTTGGLWFSHNFLRKGVYMPDPSLLTLFEKAGSKQRITSRASLRLTSRTISPMVIGFIKPCVIIPAVILSGLNTEQIEAILVHELAHIRRYDHIVMIIQAFTVQILFFHPVVWYLSSEINRERENCCDDIVVKTFSNPINYIKALTMIQELNIGGPVPANALTGKSKSLLGRIKRLLKPETKHIPAFRLAAVLLLMFTLGIAVVTFTTAGTTGNNPKPEGLFLVHPDNTPFVRDTIKNKKDQQKQINKDSGDQDVQKKKKELAESSRKLENARQELEKAQRDLDKARREVEEARRKLGSENLATANDDLQKAMDEARLFHFKMENSPEFQDQMKKLHDEMGQRQAEIRDHMQHFRNEDWPRMKQEWQKYGEEMKKAMEEFYRTHKDSGDIFYGPHPFNFKHFPPCPPVPPAIPDVELPELPDAGILSPDLEQKLEMLQQDQENDNKGKAESLDSKLREVEE